MADVYTINIHQDATLVGVASANLYSSISTLPAHGIVLRLYDYTIKWCGQNRTYNQLQVVKNIQAIAAFYSVNVSARASGSYILFSPNPGAPDLIDVWVDQQDLGKPLIIPNPGVPSGPNASVNGLAGATWDIKGYDCHGAVVAKWEKGMVGKDPVVDPLTQTVTFDNWVMAPLSKEDMVNILIKRDGVEWANIVLDACDHGIARLFGWQPRKFFLEVQSKWILNPQVVIDKGCDCGAAASDYTISRMGGPGHSDWCKVSGKA